MVRWPQNYASGVLIYPIRFIAEILSANSYMLAYFNGSVEHQIIWGNIMVRSSFCPNTKISLSRAKNLVPSTEPLRWMISLL